MKKIPEDIWQKHPQIPWKNIAGMRDILIHEYAGIDLEVVWKAIKEDIPKLKEEIAKVRKGSP